MRYDYGHGEARVNAERKRDAEKVLKRNGRTYSDLIRDLTDYLADTGGGKLPEFERLTLSRFRNGSVGKSRS